MAPSTPSGISHDPGKSQDESTSSRQQRKREIDRRAQRLARERTKTRIADLERLVDELQNRDTSGQVKSLSESLQSVSKERDAALTLARNLEASIKEFFSTRKNHHVAGSESPFQELSSSKMVPRPKGNPNGGRADEITDSTGPISPPATCDNDSASYIQPPTIEDVNLFHNLGILDLSSVLMDDTTRVISPVLPEDIPEPVQHDYSEDQTIYPASVLGCGCHSSENLPARPQTLNLWRFANEVLTKPVPLRHDTTYANDPDREYDVPIRALVKGWSTVEAELGRLPPLWSKLRLIDETLFHSCGKAERLAILKTMHTLLVYHSEQTPERRANVPAWYLERPSQTISHSYAIDFFAWPGIRERFIFYQHRYCGNIFWEVFASSLRLLWPFEFRDAYTINVETNRYTISEAFEQRIKDINAWTMTRDIFDRWPEFYSDIPTFPHLSKQISFKPAFLIEEPTETNSNHDSRVGKILDGFEVVRSCVQIATGS